MQLSIVVPCLNEIEAIGPFFETMKVFASQLVEKTFIQELELVVVDDGSSDGSSEALKNLKLPFKFVLSSEGINRGYGGALKHGFMKCTGDLIAFLDLDNTYNPFDLIPMIQLLDKQSLDMVSGDRLSLLSGMPMTRKFGNHFFVLIINQLFNRKVFDCCSGMRVFKKELVIPFLKLLPDQLDFTLGMTFLFLHFEKPFQELPISYCDRTGRSKLVVAIDGPRFLWTIFRYWYRCRFDQRFVALANEIW
jgi:glycosyltransferase involved in cell wall biosynthesis